MWSGNSSYSSSLSWTPCWSDIALLCSLVSPQSAGWQISADEFSTSAELPLALTRFFALVTPIWKQVLRQLSTLSKHKIPKPVAVTNTHPDRLTTQKAQSKPAQLIHLVINPHILCGRDCFSVKGEDTKLNQECFTVVWCNEGPTTLRRFPWLEIYYLCHLGEHCP